MGKRAGSSGVRRRPVRAGLGPTLGEGSPLRSGRARSACGTVGLWIAPRPQASCGCRAALTCWRCSRCGAVFKPDWPPVTSIGRSSGPAVTAQRCGWGCRSATRGRRTNGCRASARPSSPSGRCRRRILRRRNLERSIFRYAAFSTVARPAGAYTTRSSTERCRSFMSGMAVGATGGRDGLEERAPQVEATVELDAGSRVRSAVLGRSRHGDRSGSSECDAAVYFGERSDGIKRQSGHAGDSAA